MQEKHTTYTYTARSVDNPEKVVTFTLYNGHMRVNLTGVLDQARQVAEAEQKPDEIKDQLAAQARPAIAKLAEKTAGPVHVSDVNANLDEDNLHVTFWQRLAGLRLAPVMFSMGEVDNVDAAEAFVEEVQNRKETASHASRFFGPLDYWIGWVGLLMLVGFLFRWPGRRNKD